MATQLDRILSIVEAILEILILTHSHDGHFKEIRQAAKAAKRHLRVVGA